MKTLQFVLLSGLLLFYSSCYWGEHREGPPERKKSISPSKGGKAKASFREEKKMRAKSMKVKNMKVKNTKEATRY